MLPTQLENLVAHYAYGEGRYNLYEELDFVLTNRGMVPDAFQEHCVVALGYAPRMARALGFYMVKNPLRTDNPFVPWALVDPGARVFNNTFLWWWQRVARCTYRKLRTYKKTLWGHVARLSACGRDFSPEWNRFMNRYLSSAVLADPANYNTQEHELLFKVVCEQIENAGFICPKTSLPPRPSQRSVLSRAYGPHA